MPTRIHLEVVDRSGTSIKTICLLKKSQIRISNTYNTHSFRSVRNFVIDVRRMPATASATGIHWQVSQATSLINVVVDMSTDPSTAHQGELTLVCCSKLLANMNARHLHGKWKVNRRLLLLFDMIDS